MHLDDMSETVNNLLKVITKQQFLTWLDTPNSQLEGKTPLELLFSGEQKVVEDLMDDMLRGMPT